FWDVGRKTVTCIGKKWCHPREQQGLSVDAVEFRKEHVSRDDGTRVERAIRFTLEGGKATMGFMYGGPTAFYNLMGYSRPLGRCK
ncbi:MAG: hypothetical protein MI741_07285, partial [Rhodospirillales bacterium]|nr:hypothetical protein [Rhodospirillales bacterium]